MTAYPSYPASTSTGFDDLARIKPGQRFILQGYIYEALGEASTARAHGIQTVSIHAKRENPAMPSGWELATVSEWRTYTAPLGDILTAAEKMA